MRIIQVSGQVSDRHKPLNTSGVIIHYKTHNPYLEDAVTNELYYVSTCHVALIAGQIYIPLTPATTSCGRH